MMVRPVVLERELARVRQYGDAHDNEELELGVRRCTAGIAVAINDPLNT